MTGLFSDDGFLKRVQDWLVSPFMSIGLSDVLTSVSLFKFQISKVPVPSAVANTAGWTGDLQNSKISINSLRLLKSIRTI
jgi:hypothetical protein